MKRRPPNWFGPRCEDCRHLNTSHGVGVADADGRRESGCQAFLNRGRGGRRRKAEERTSPIGSFDYDIALKRCPCKIVSP